MIITLKTDNPEAEIGLYEGQSKRSYFTWRADRQLAKDLLKVLHEQLQTQKADWPDVTGIVVFQGPGSFTGLRIGITVANAIAYGNNIPIVTTQGDDWLKTGLQRLKDGENDQLALPHYGAEAHITQQKK